MKRLFFLVMSVLLPTMVLATASSCKSKTTSASEPVEKGSVVIEPIVTERVEDEIGNRNDYNSFDVSVTIDYPVSGSQCETVLKYIAGQLVEENQVEALLQKTNSLDFVKFAESRIQERLKRENSGNQGAEYFIKILKISDSNSFLSLCTSQGFLRKGAMIGWSKDEYVTVSLLNGSIISKAVKDDDSFIKSMQPLLQKGLVKWLVAELQDFDPEIDEESVNEEMFNPDFNHQIPIENSILTNDGVLFFYESTDGVFPYSSYFGPIMNNLGSPSVTIPYEQILPYLTDEALEIYNMAFGESDASVQKTQAIKTPDNATKEQNERMAAFIKDMWDNSRYENYDFLEKHCTPKMLKMLKDNWNSEGYDLEVTNIPEEGYETLMFYVGFHDGPLRERNRVYKVTPLGDGWYRYDFFHDGSKCAIKLKMLEKNGVIMMDDLVTIDDGYGN